MTASASGPTSALPELAEGNGPPGATEADPEHLDLLGRSGSVPLGFVRTERRIYLVARERSARWPVSVLREGSAVVRISGELYSGPVDLVTDPAGKRVVLERFLAKFGSVRFARWYDHPARILEIRLESRDPPEASPAPPYVDWLTAEFDNVADDYDRHIAGNRINVLLRDRSLAHLRERFRTSPSLLEIGCGSGMETLPLLEEGHEIFCLDISPRMLEVVRAKAHAAGLQERLRTRRLRAGQLGELLPEVGRGAFDGGYSTYGALNCEEDLTPIPGALHELLGPGSRFVAGVYNRWCAFEVLGYAISGQPTRALGRLGRPIPVGASRFCVDVYAHSVGDFDRLFAPYFDRERTEAVPVLLPPSDLMGYAERFSRHFDRLSRWDRRLGAAWPFRFFGDHFLSTFRRRDDRGRGGPSARRPTVTPARS